MCANVRQFHPQGLQPSPICVQLYGTSLSNARVDIISTPARPLQLDSTLYTIGRYTCAIVAPKIKQVLLLAELRAQTMPFLWQRP